jgi:hypothetical protein
MRSIESARNAEMRTKNPNPARPSPWKKPINAATLRLKIFAIVL